jgi:hypothetical protein
MTTGRFSFQSTENRENRFSTKVLSRVKGAVSLPVVDPRWLTTSWLTTSCHGAHLS